MTRIDRIVSVASLPLFPLLFLSAGAVSGGEESAVPRPPAADPDPNPDRDPDPEVASVSLESLLREMVDRDRLARYPTGTRAFTAAQASSHDRRSVSEEEEGWFANNDWSHFLRVETVEGRREWVMMDEEGPGCITRIWMGGSPPYGRLRVYIDGAEEPSIEGGVDEIIGGTKLVGPPLSAIRARGRNLYLPVPYARRCKVTYDGENFWETRNRGIRTWYIIQHRRYLDPRTRVRSFSPEGLEAARPLLREIGRTLLRPEEAIGEVSVRRSTRATLGPSGSLQAEVAADAGGALAIRKLAASVRGADTAEALRDTILRIDVDGEETVSAPVGHFFGSGEGLHPYRGWFREVRDDGRMLCYWVMPLRERARVRLQYRGDATVQAELEVAAGPFGLDERSMRFRAGHRRERIRVEARRGRDWRFATLEGQGVLVGDTLSIHNGARTWWGEGDEKIRVDGEAFPSFFGTGTEDYYGYSYGDAAFFEAPFHAQPTGAGNGSVGWTTNTRSRSLDAIPFRESLRFDMEVWHWGTCEMEYAATTFWYERPSAATSGSSPAKGHLRISGIYPHLATHNQPEEEADRPRHGEAGIGAIVPWAGKLWYITYPQHKTTGSNDKLYEVDESLRRTVRPESVGGTHACRMIHRESNQLIIGPYFIDARGKVRSPDLRQLRGRMTAVMRHLREPARLVYFFDMEGAIYEVDVHTLEVKRLFVKPVPGWHGKGGYTAQGRVVIANNGEHGNDRMYEHVLVGGEARGEEAGVLAEWDGETWRIVERKQFLDVTGPGGLLGSRTDTSPLWAFGWDKRSVILKLLDGGEWHTFRLPKASHTFDPVHGWFTEWPRIREIAPERPMMCAHGTLFDFPIAFRARYTGGIRPISTHLRYIPDFTHWRGEVLLGADDSSMMGNPMCGQAQSNIWFGKREELERFGPRAGHGAVWVGDSVRPGDVSEPFLLAGYAQRTAHFAVNAAQPVRFDLEVDAHGRGDWKPFRSVRVGGYAHLVIPADLTAEWVRVRSEAECVATVYFHYLTPRRARGGEEEIFSGLADASRPIGYAGGRIRPAAHNRSLQWLRRTVDASGRLGPEEYIEVELEGTTRLRFDRDAPDRSDEVRRVARMSRDFEVDAASVIVTDREGRRWRLPKGLAAFDDPLPTGGPRGIREVVSERHLAQIHGTFYEIPRTGTSVAPSFREMKPVASHDRVVDDFCTWRGLLVIAGARTGAAGDGHVFAGDDGQGLWFGAVDDLWKLGKPVGDGGPWKETEVRAGEPSDPYLVTGYDRKSVRLAHDEDRAVTFTIEIDMDHRYYRRYAEIEVEPGDGTLHRFPEGFHAHWVRLRTGADCRATAWFEYR